MRHTIASAEVFLAKYVKEVCVNDFFPPLELSHLFSHYSYQCKHSHLQTLFFLHIMVASGSLGCQDWHPNVLGAVYAQS